MWHISKNAHAAVLLMRQVGLIHSTSHIWKVIQDLFLLHLNFLDILKVHVVVKVESLNLNHKYS